MPPGLFQNNQLPASGESANTDQAMQQAARRNGTVGTAKPINGFTAATAGDVESEKRGLKQRREQSKFFRQLLAINLQWQEVDVTDTKALTQWRAATLKNLMRKALVVARGVAKQEVLGAQFQQRVGVLREATNQRITDLQQRKQAAKQRVQR